MQGLAGWADGELSPEIDRSAIVFCGAGKCTAYKEHPDEVQAAHNRGEFCPSCLPNSRVCGTCGTRSMTPPWPHTAARWIFWGSDRPQEGAVVTHEALIAALVEKMSPLSPEVAILTAEQVLGLHIRSSYNPKTKETLDPATRDITLEIFDLNKSLMFAAKEFKGLLGYEALHDITANDYVRLNDMYFVPRPADAHICTSCNLEMPSHGTAKRTWTADMPVDGSLDNPLNSEILINQVFKTLKSKFKTDNAKMALSTCLHSLISRDVVEGLHSDMARFRECVLSFLKEFHSPWMCDDFPIDMFTQNVYANIVHNMTLNSVADASCVFLSDVDITTILESVIGECLAHARSHLTSLDDMPEEDLEFNPETCCSAERITFSTKQKNATLADFINGNAYVEEDTSSSEESKSEIVEDDISKKMVPEDEKLIDDDNRLLLRHDLTETQADNEVKYSDDDASGCESDAYGDREGDKLQDLEDMIHPDDLQVIEEMINWHGWTQFFSSLNDAMHIRTTFLRATDNLNAATGNPPRPSKNVPDTWRVVLKEVASAKCTAVQHVLSLSTHAMRVLYPGCAQGFGSDSFWTNVSGTHSSTMLHGAHNFDDKIRNDNALLVWLSCGLHLLTDLARESLLGMCRKYHENEVKHKCQTSEFPAVDIKSAEFIELDAEGKVPRNTRFCLNIAAGIYTKYLNTERSLEKNHTVSSHTQSSSGREEMKLILGDNLNPDTSHVFHNSDLTGFTIILMVLEIFMQQELEFNRDLEKDIIRWLVLGYLFCFNSTIATFYYLYTGQGPPRNSTAVEKSQMQDSCYAAMHGQHTATDWNRAKVLCTYYAREMRDPESVLYKFAETFFKDADEMKTMMEGEATDRRQLCNYLKDSMAHLFTKSAELTTVTPLHDIQGICKNLSEWTDNFPFLFLSFVEPKNAFTAHQQSLVHYRSNAHTICLDKIFGDYTELPSPVAPLDPSDAKETGKNVDKKVAIDVAELTLLRKQNSAQTASIEKLKAMVLELQRKSGSKSKTVPPLPKRRKADVSAGGSGKDVSDSKSNTVPPPPKRRKADGGAGGSGKDVSGSSSKPATVTIRDKLLAKFKGTGK